MKKYCYIQNGQVILVEQDLPVNFENVSNFHVLDDDSLKMFGWLPYEKVSDDRPIYVSSSFEILKDKVIETVITRDKNEEEKKQEESIEILKEWDFVRSKRNKILEETDKAVVVDKWLMMDDTSKVCWTNYRKQLRDLPQMFESPFGVIWPMLSS